MTSDEQKIVQGSIAPIKAEDVMRMIGQKQKQAEANENPLLDRLKSLESARARKADIEYLAEVLREAVRVCERLAKS